MKHGDYVGVTENGKIGCPILQVATVTESGFTLALQTGETRLYLYNEGIWGKVSGNELEESMDCGCCRCNTPLFELALSAE